MFKHYAINSDRQKKVQLNTFSILALAGLSGKIHSPTDLAAGEKKASDAHRLEGSVGYRIGLVV